ncbi:hypothetical protein Ddye_023076 [Dipteronia dyeriana]|uniref:Uncharacterized protein n=1 Tax=Dipteronia dyeriana TaxID=168575 RepID=A0AAD9WSW8_9ROSI|nr:hypothetical protein Ddye_023076 [Dipteronia dyeriana]
MANAEEKCQRHFFWGDGIEKRNLHAIDWETICLSKRKGGLGVGKVMVKNKGCISAKILVKGFRVVVGCGDKVSLWNDVWRDELPLKVTFPRIFVLSSIKEGTISQFRNWEGEVWKWVSNFAEMFSIGK